MDSISKIREQAGNKWYDWKWQSGNRIHNLEMLRKYVLLSPEEEEIFHQSKQLFSFGATPYYLSLIQPENPDCPIRKQILPSAIELTFRGTEKEDPLEEEKFAVVGGLIHRFHDRVLWYLTHQCSAYCRFCTRKRKVSDGTTRPGIHERDEAFLWLEHHTEIKEVILSGGDPLTLSDGFLRDILIRLKKIPHINHIRIHTRIPVVMPMRITDELCDIFKDHYPLYIVSHFNHPNECTTEAEAALKKLATQGNCVLLNQNVLLAGVNDNVMILEKLFYRLTAMGVKPYYMHHCDEIKGISGFRVPYRKGMNIMKELRNRISGICLPEFVVDFSGAKGKTPLYPYMLEP